MASAVSLPKEEMIQSLANAYLFEHFSKKDLQAVIGHFKPVTVKKNDILFYQGDPSLELYIISKGRFKIFTGDRKNRFKHEIGAAAPGDLLGEIMILAGGRRTASVKAASPACLLSLSANQLGNLARQFPELAEKMRQVIRKRVRQNTLIALLSDLMGPMDASMIEDIVKQARWQTMKRGQTLFRKGDDGNDLYIVIHGKLQASGRNNKILGDIGKGEMVGEMSVFTNEKRSATIRALRQSELVAFSKDSFEWLNQKHPRLLTRIIHILIQRLKQSNQSETRKHKSVIFAVVPIHPSVRTDKFIDPLKQVLSRYGDVVHLSARMVDDALQETDICQCSDKDTANIRLSTWLNDLESQTDYMIYETAPEESNWTLRSASAADQILLLADSRAASAKTAVEKQIIQNANGMSFNTALILLHPKDCRKPKKTMDWLKHRQINTHYHIREDHDNDFDRLGRLLTQNGIGLVFSGGGAKGFAHIGVIRALNEAGIPIDMVGGTSMGGVIACNYALGWNYDRIFDAHYKEFKFNNPFTDYTLPLYSLLKCQKLDDVLMRYFKDHTMEDLWINCFVVSSSLTTNCLVVHEHGLIRDNVRASVALPGITTPAIQDNQFLVDGGILNNLPGDIMKKRCQGKVIGVNVNEESVFTPNLARFPTPSRRIIQRLNPFEKEPNAPPGILELLSRCIVLSSEHHLGEMKKNLDFYMVPPVGDYNTLDFEKVEEIILTGYDYAITQIDALKKAVMPV
jgi:predicted acylesterase/phospholipase RssA/CRP-like cAMP-binding protein